MSELHKKEYLSRIHRAQDYIERNLGEELLLENIAREACFSPYHFHRVFSAVAGETLYQFILRLRLERAATVLAQHEERPVTQIALDLGFGSAATFARAFQGFFGMSASTFRKNCKAQSKDWKDSAALRIYLEQQVQQPTSRKKQMTNVQPKQPLDAQVMDLPARTFAYLRHVGPYAGDSELFGRLWGQLGQWAGPRGLFQRPGAESLCIYHDNPEITEQEKLRISLGLTVAVGTEVPPPFQTLEIPAGQYLVARFEIDVTEYANAWAYVMGEWLPQSGYQCDDRPCYETYLNDPKTHPQGKHIIAICEPVKPL